MYLGGQQPQAQVCEYKTVRKPTHSIGRDTSSQVTDVVNGLAYLQSHKPHEIVHGDLKPVSSSFLGSILILDT